MLIGSTDGGEVLCLQRIATFLAAEGSNYAEKQSGAGGRSMAKIIEFYVPQDFRRRPGGAAKRGQIIEFVSQPKKSA